MESASEHMGNLMILASAGSGKTHQLVNRVIGLVARGADPAEIVALTFTRKAAGEFADAVLTRLAAAVADPAKADRLREEIGVPAADFEKLLEQVVDALTRWSLGTIDGFFSRIIRAFPQELGISGGHFELVEGPRARLLANQLLEQVLLGSKFQHLDEEFFLTFRRATMGREKVQMLQALRRFIETWHGAYRENPKLQWGPAGVDMVEVEEWEARKHGFAKDIRDRMDAIQWTRNGQDAAFEKMIGLIENHTIGSGKIVEHETVLWKGLIEDIASGAKGPMELKSHKAFTIPESTAEQLRNMVRLCVRCELSAATRRTMAIRGVVREYDELAERRLRGKGLLGFADVKALMGRWAHDEDARLRREAVDFRLDARHRHWLLDEFQDTSRADWAGISPLINEIVSADDGSLFLVGDKKQAIYAWRGGDVTLFDEIHQTYGKQMDRRGMADSYRSCPEVLDLVNRVCGDMSAISSLFGEVADVWEWEHHQSASHLCGPEHAGESTVEEVEDWEARQQRTLEILRERKVGEVDLSCAVLLRQNDKAKEMADFLRGNGYDVVLDGTNRPATDSPVGWLILQTLRWLANPADPMARGVLEMSPAGRAEILQHDSSWEAMWSVMIRRVSQRGFAGAMRAWLAPHAEGWSDFGRSRFETLIAALREIDQQGILSAGEAAKWLEELEVAQAPGKAVVQVMTIHKSKGLGFDLVVLAEVSDEKIPNATHYDIVEQENWVLDPPPRWVRSLVPELADAEDAWSKKQQYEAMCMLYVALTRAKRGLHVLLDQPGKHPDPDKPSLANWMRRALQGSSPTDGILFHSGSPDWSKDLPPLPTNPPTERTTKLGSAVRR